MTVPQAGVPGHAAEVPPLPAVRGKKMRPLAADDLQRHRARLGAPGVKDAGGLSLGDGDRRGHAWEAALASAQASAKTSVTTSACASVRMSGGEKRIAFLPHSSTSRPRR